MAKLTKPSRNTRILIVVILVAILLFKLPFATLIMSNPPEDTNKNSPEPDVGTCRIINFREVCSGDYVGLSEDDAMAKARANNLSARVVGRDDEMLAVTMDYSPDRLNFVVKDGVVVSSRFD